MTEAQMLARRALQEALDRRDNGGAPTAGHEPRGAGVPSTDRATARASE